MQEGCFTSPSVLVASAQVTSFVERIYVIVTIVTAAEDKMISVKEHVLHNIIDKPILYKRTRTIIVNPINWLQVLQHASGRELYLTVDKYNSYWTISSTIGGWRDPKIRSSSAGGMCPADKAAGWDKDVNVTCATHS